MKAAGKIKRDYRIDTKKIIAAASDGTVYPVSGKKDLYAKLLMEGLGTKEKEMELDAMMRGEISSMEETPTDLLYSKGRLIGYVFQKTEEAASDPTPDPVYGGQNLFGTGGDRGMDDYFTDNDTAGAQSGLTAAQIIYSIAVGILFSLLNAKFLFVLYESLMINNFQDVANECIVFNFSGLTGMVGGCAFLVAGNLTVFKEMKGPVYFLLQPVVYLVGVTAAYFLVTVLILLFVTAMKMIVAIIPTIVTIIVLVFAIKYLFSLMR